MKIIKKEGKYKFKDKIDLYNFFMRAKLGRNKKPEFGNIRQTPVAFLREGSIK